MRFAKSSAVAVLWVFALLAAAETTAAPDSISADWQVSRVSGRAPLMVFFDATSTTDTDTSKPIHHLTYCFDAGDGNQDRYALAGHKTTPKSTFCGAPLYAYVYETPGTYTAALNVRGADGDVAVRSVQITVSDYTPAQTTCVSSSGNFSGCPAGAARVVSADYNANANRTLRVLYRCEESFSQTRTVDFTTDGAFIGAYNDGGVVKGRDCRYNVTGARGYEPFYIDADDVRMLGGNRTGNGREESLINFSAGPSNDPDHILVQNWNLDNMGRVFISTEYGQAGSQLPRYWGFFSVRSNGCGAYGQCVATVTEYLALVDMVLSGSSQHVIRLFHGEDTFIHNIRVSNYAVHGITIRGLGDNHPAGYPSRFAENNFISDSWIEGDEVWPLQNGGGNGDGLFLRMRNNVIERNYFTTSSSLSGNGADLRPSFYIATGVSGSAALIRDMTYRNNVFDMRNTGAGSSAMNAGSNNSGIEFYGNSGYSDGTRRSLMGGGSCAVMQGNVFWEAGGTTSFGSRCTITSSNYDSDGGEAGVQGFSSCPFASCPPGNVAGFAPSAGFLAAATRVSSPNLLDFNQMLRAQGITRLPGAFELREPAPNPPAQVTAE